MKRRVMFDEDVTLRGAINIAKACAANVSGDKGHIAFEVILNSRKAYCVQPLGTHKYFKSHTLVATVPIPEVRRRAKAKKRTVVKTTEIARLKRWPPVVQM